MVSYEGLKKKLQERGLHKTDLTAVLGLSSRTIAKIGKGEKLLKRTQEKIADFLDCDMAALCHAISENTVLQLLQDEKSAKISGGLYHELQVRMTYNSNHIEGSTLTEAQTRRIFETNTVGVDANIPVDDILETVHHFRAIDYVIDVAEEPVSEKIIKHLHFLLKHDTKEAQLPWFAVGDYKRQANMVGGRETASPEEVPRRMKSLLQLIAEKPPSLSRTSSRFTPPSSRFTRSRTATAASGD